MKYNWNIHEIRNNIVTLNNMLKFEKEEEKRETILCQIETYKTMLNITVSKKYNGLESDVKKLTVFETVKSFFEGFEPEKEEDIYELVADSYPIIRDFSCDNITISTVICDNETLLYNTDIFLSKYLPSELYQRFLKFKKENPDYLHIQKDCGLNAYHGITFTDYVLLKKYVLALRNNTIQDLVTLPHEIFHTIFNDYNEETFFNSLYYTHEIEGSFANFLVTDFYLKEMPDFGRELMAYFLYDYQENIKSLLYGIYYLASLTEKFHFRENKFHKLIASYQLPNITSEEQLKLCLSSNYAETINYSLAYLAGLDLYKIYINDPELAIYLLQNIRYAKEEQNVIQLLRRNHITFMNDGYQNLKDHVKQIKKVL